MNKYIYILVTQDVEDDIPKIRTTFIEAKDQDEAEEKGYEFFKSDPRLSKTFVNECIVELPKK